ncbi:MAG: NAD(P)H-hydrate dehydratase [Spirochaetia bacterium]|nr:NAD(P)H-hydrate dehydratase [Spirochaetia bacterium]
MPKHNNEDLRHWFLKRPDDHKYTAGHGLLVGGSFGMEGAFLLAARSFFAAGGGILHAVLPPQSSRADLLSSEPSAMYRDGFLELGRMPHSVGVGPGLSQADLAALSNPLLDFLSEWSRSDPQGWVILDASAASLILHPRYPESARARTILTPHGGEWKALGGPAVDCADGLKSAHAWNRSTTKANAHVKGAVSTLLTSQTSFIHAKPNPSLAAAGSGDCLTGIFLAAASRRHSNAPRVEDIAGASADLLDAAARSMIHPASSDFPGAIRAVLGLGSTGAS